MNIILLSGGSGKRLWPLSNEVRSKQFLKILKTRLLAIPFVLKEAFHLEYTKFCFKDT